MRKQGQSIGRRSVEIIFLIPTYNRPHLLLGLLKGIAKLPCKFRVKIYNDGSTEDYSRVEKFLKKNIEDYYYCITPHYGKYKFYELHRKMYKEMKPEKFKYFAEILDDMLLVENFYPKVINQFHESGGDLLNIINPEGFNEWMTERGYEKKFIGENEYWEIQWLDLCFITTRNFLRVFKFTCPKVPDKFWKKRKTSGVSTALTLAYTKLGGKIFLTDKSLLIHTGEESVMNTHRKGYKSRLCE